MEVQTAPDSPMGISISTAVDILVKVTQFWKMTFTERGGLCNYISQLKYWVLSISQDNN